MKSRIISASQIKACPKHSLLPQHYSDDGTCGCPDEREYRVKWEIDITARSRREAAEKALEIQRDPESVVVAFNVDGVEVDLLSEGERT